MSVPGVNPDIFPCSPPGRGTGSDLLYCKKYTSNQEKFTCHIPPRRAPDTFPFRTPTNAPTWSSHYTNSCTKTALFSPTKPPWHCIAGECWRCKNSLSSTCMALSQSQSAPLSTRGSTTSHRLASWGGGVQRWYLALPPLIMLSSRSTTSHHCLKAQATRVVAGGLMPCCSRPLSRTPSLPWNVELAHVRQSETMWQWTRTPFSYLESGMPVPCVSTKICHKTT